MDRKERLAMLGSTVSPAFDAETKTLGHTWERRPPKGLAVCSKCGCESKHKDERWKAECAGKKDQ